MLLVVDVGNTQTHIGLMSGGEVVGEWRIATVRHRTSDEIAGLLQGFFSHEYELMRGLTRYYLSECGIQLLPFLRDQNDRMQLLNVLEHYAEHMPASELMYLQEFREMEGLLDG